MCLFQLILINLLVDHVVLINHVNIVIMVICALKGFVVCVIQIIFVQMVSHVIMDIVLKVVMEINVKMEKFALMENVIIVKINYLVKNHILGLFVINLMEMEK